jgi:hypothetical protein
MHSIIHYERQHQIGVIITCYNFLTVLFFELTQAFYKHHWKTQNDELIYVEFKNIKHGETRQVEMYYEHIQKLVYGL